MVDTGSMVSLITQSTISTLDLREIDIKDYQGSIYSYSSHKIDTQGRVVLEVSFSPGNSLKHDFIIVPDKYMGTGILLGFDLISRKSWTWERDTKNFVWSDHIYNTCDNNRYTVGTVTVKTLKGISDDESNEGMEQKIQVNQKLKLKPGEIYWLKCKGKKNSTYQVTSLPIKTIGRNLCLAKYCVIETDQNGYGHIPLSNPLKKNVSLKIGTTVASMEEVDGHQVSFFSRNGKNRLGSLKEVSELLDGMSCVHMCPSHLHIFSSFYQSSTNTNQTPPTLQVTEPWECEICSGEIRRNQVGHEAATVNQVEDNTGIHNEMLPHLDTVEGDMTRVERLQKLVAQLDLKHLGKKDRDSLEGTLLKHVDLFILGEREMGLINLPDNHITMLDTEPVRMPLYRHPENAKKIIEEMIQTMLDKDIIEESYSTYLSPIVLINKPNGSKRMCIDYRGVNKKIKIDIHPLPRLDELVDEVAGNKYYCTLDMKDAYYQCRLDEESRDITSFSDGKNLYRFKRLPFGLNVAPAIFTRVMQEVLRPLLKLGFVKNYLDDVIVFAHDFDTLLGRLNSTFQRMAEMGLKLNVSKCHFAQTRIKFLGHIVSEKGMEVNPESVEGIVKMTFPKTTREVRRFIGMCSFYRKFIPDFAKIAAPLTSLQSKIVKYVWTPECQEAFEQLKQKLTSTPVLRKADLKKEFELHTDASDCHVGAVLMQKEEDGLHPIGYFSKKLLRCERRYSVTDKEALGIVKATRFFHHYLWGKRFVINTDHQPLTTIFKKKTHSPRMSRYMLEMRDYCFDIVYRKGAVNYVPDALSRPNSKYAKVNLVEDSSVVTKFPGLTSGKIREEQRKDRRWKEVIDYCEGGQLPSKLPGNRTLSCFEMRDDILYLRREEFRRITFCLVIPETLRAIACSIIHNETHLGQHKSVKRAQQMFFWPRMWKDIVNFVKSCKVCQQFKEAGALVYKWQELPPVDRKGKRVAIDLIDMHSSSTGHRYCLTVMDHFSRFIRAYPLRNKSTQSVLKEMTRDVCIFGTPSLALMDNGSEFTSTEFREFCQQAGINQVTCLPYHPRGNSVLERAHRTLKSVIAMLSREHPHQWPKHLPNAVKILNEAVHTSLGTSPFFVQYGYHPLRKIGTLELPDQEDEEEDETGRNLGIREQIMETLKNQTDYYRNKANVGRSNETLQVGDLAWIYQEFPIPGTAVKLNRKWIGPYRVTSVLGEGRAYELVSTLTDEVVKRAAGKLKKYIPREEILDQIEEEFLTAIEEEKVLPEKRIRKPPMRYSP